MDGGRYGRPGGGDGRCRAHVMPRDPRRKRDSAGAELPDRGRHPALWDAFYEPLASSAHLDYVGGSASGPGGETRQAPRSLGYTVDGPDGVNNTLSIDAFNWDGRILAVITLRRGRP
jgi:hypothetical protein